MAISIHIPDTLRKTVESASGGLNTVLYTTKGQPSYFRVIPKRTLESFTTQNLGTGTHPAFKVTGGADKENIFIGMYTGVVRNGELLSLPGVEPSHSYNHDQFITYARAGGTGWHCITNQERALLGHLCYEQGFYPGGNNNYGQHESTGQYGVGPDGLKDLGGSAAGNTRTLTGSGPTSWRHDNTPFGISDLNGNVWEWSPGMRLNAGEIQIIPNNDAALNTTDLGSSSVIWKAIDGSTGELVAPGSANTVKYAVSGTTNYTLVRTNGTSFEGMTNPGSTPVSATALAICKAQGLYPVASSGLGNDYFYVDVTGERCPLFGGHWGGIPAAGVWALSLALVRPRVDYAVGSRVAAWS